ncbi:MAG: hypothetical protein H6736_20355 [Alphaproteobacteria bacterium]|nr:hypothetical protein [Alphaproteobacteria bacterium]
MIALLALLASAAEVDRLAVAARLLADGHADRAADVLAEVEPRKAERARYHTLRGMVAFARDDLRTAADQLALAVELDPPDIARVTLAAARVGLGEHEAALDALRPVTEALPAVPLLEARALAGLGRHDAALEAVDRGREAFPADVALVEEGLAQLVAVGLYGEVVRTGPDALVAVGAPAVAWERALQGLVEGEAWPEVVAFGEELLLAVPDSLRARLALASAHLADGRDALAGAFLADAAAFDPQYAVQAAECFRRAGDLERALYLNGLVVDPAEKARQRLGLLLERGRYAEAAALDARLDRLGLLAEDQVAFALAWSHARLGNRDRTEALVARLVDPAFARQGTALLETLP